METVLFEVSETSSSRKRIEDDLFIRHKALQRKIEALKVRRSKEEIRHNKPIPTINPHSRRLAEKSEKSSTQSSAQLERAQELLQNSRFFPRKAKISLEELNKSLSQSCLKKSLKTEPEVFLQIKPSKSETLLKFPSLISLAKQSKLPADILTRNLLLSTLRQETVSRGFLTEPEEPPSVLMIHERSQAWLKKKHEKIREMKEKEDEKNLQGCTFKPKVGSSRFFSLNQSQRTLSADTSYASLYQRKKKFRSASKNSEFPSRISQNHSKSICSLGSLKIKDSSSSANSPVYSQLCPVKMVFSDQNGFSDTLKHGIRVNKKSC
jgi:hypothetical protein